MPAAPGGNALTLNIAGDLTIDLPTVAGGGRISGDVTTRDRDRRHDQRRRDRQYRVHGSGASGAKITSNQTAGSCSGGRGGNISLSANGSIITEAGSAITSTSICGMGEIIIVADVAVTLKGVVSSDSSIGRGGPVSVSAGCTLAVAPTGRVTSQGKDPGADLVHLQGGCDVLIQGKVESTGPGHVRPPANRCHAPDRSDKPDNASACVEIWSGGTLTIDSTGVLKGEINADTAQSGGVQLLRVDRSVRAGGHPDQGGHDRRLRGARQPVGREHVLRRLCHRQVDGRQCLRQRPRHPGQRHAGGRQGWDRHHRSQGRRHPGRGADSRQGRYRWPAGDSGVAGRLARARSAGP